MGIKALGALGSLLETANEERTLARTGKYLEEMLEMQKSANKFIGPKTRELAAIENNLNDAITEAQDIITNLKKLRKFGEGVEDAGSVLTPAKRLRALENKLKGIEDDIEKLNNMKQKAKQYKKLRWAGKSLGVMTGLGVGSELFYDNYMQQTHDEMLRTCQCACQGFNKKNLKEEKWDQVNKILYCRNADGSSCDLEGGECPSGCTLNMNNNKTSSYMEIVMMI